jgi:hypothetical protein
MKMLGKGTSTALVRAKTEWEVAEPGYQNFIGISEQIQIV